MAGLGDAFEARCDIDAVAHQVAVVLLHDVAKMDADTKFDAVLLGIRQRCDTPSRPPSDALRTPSATLRSSTMAAVAGTLTTRPVLSRDAAIDQIAAQRPQARERPLFIGAREPAEATTSAARIAASLRVSVVTALSAAASGKASLRRQEVQQIRMRVQWGETPTIPATVSTAFCAATPRPLSNCCSRVLRASVETS